MRECKDNDRIFIHDGNYILKQLKQNYTEYNFHKTIQMIGIGHNTTIEIGNYTRIMTRAYFENITFGSTDAEEDMMAIYANYDTKFWVKNCNFWLIQE